MQTNTELKVDYLPIEDIINLCPKWFGKNETRFFKSKWDKVVYKLGDIGYFISSEKFEGEARKYTIRRFSFTEKRFLIVKAYLNFNGLTLKLKLKTLCFIP